MAKAPARAKTAAKPAPKKAAATKAAPKRAAASKAAPRKTAATRAAPKKTAATRAAPKRAAAAKAAPKKAMATKATAKLRSTASAKPRTAAAKPAPRTAARATTRTAAKAAPRGTPQLRASAGAAARRAAAERPAGPPRPARARKVKLALDLLERLVEAGRRSLEDDKAENIVVLDVTGRADYADRLMIATGLADRQIQAMATHLEEAFAKEGLKLRRDAVEISPDWVLIAAGDLVVHLFKPEARDRYALERMWGPESPSADVPQDRTPLPEDETGGSTATEDDDE
jgi:ribosome-associated protein